MTLLLIRLARFASIAGPPAILTLITVALFTVLIAAGPSVKESRTIFQSMLVVLPWTGACALGFWLAYGSFAAIEQKQRILHWLLRLENQERARLRTQREAAGAERIRVERDADECIRLIQP